MNRSGRIQTVCNGEFVPRKAEMTSLTRATPGPIRPTRRPCRPATTIGPANDDARPPPPMGPARQPVTSQSSGPSDSPRSAYSPAPAMRDARPASEVSCQPIPNRRPRHPAKDNSLRHSLMASSTAVAPVCSLQPQPPGCASVPDVPVARAAKPSDSIPVQFAR